MKLYLRICRCLPKTCSRKWDFFDAGQKPWFFIMVWSTKREKLPQKRLFYTMVSHAWPVNACRNSDICLATRILRVFINIVLFSKQSFEQWFTSTCMSELRHQCSSIRCANVLPPPFRFAWSHRNLVVPPLSVTAWDHGQHSSRTARSHVVPSTLNFTIISLLNFQKYNDTSGIPISHTSRVLCRRSDM